MRGCFGSNVVKFSLLFTRNYRKNRFLMWSMCPWDTLLTCYLFLEDMTLHLNIIYLKIQLFSYGEKNTCVDITFAYIGIRKVGGEPSNFFSKYKLNAIKALKLKVVELDPTYIPLSICFQWWCIQHQNYLNAKLELNYHLLTWELHATWIFHLSIDNKTKWMLIFCSVYFFSPREFTELIKETKSHVVIRFRLGLWLLLLLFLSYKTKGN